MQKQNAGAVFHLISLLPLKRVGKIDSMINVAQEPTELMTTACPIQFICCAFEYWHFNVYILFASNISFPGAIQNILKYHQSANNSPLELSWIFLVKVMRIRTFIYLFIF